MTESHGPYITRRFSKETERRLEEIRQILSEAKPLPEPSALERLDAEAIVDRTAFKRRFGRDWPSHHQREALIQLRQERDWTDGEIKLFLITGTLQRGPLGVRPSADSWTAAWGSVLIVGMLFLVAGIAAAVLARIVPWSFGTAVHAAGDVLLFSGFAWVVYQMHVRPWRIQRRT
ncbi:MAG: hypothetical protein P4L92_14390 [Rudaea sp.]|nr:hypothetical protein [Rudaea sp.]